MPPCSTRSGALGFRTACQRLVQILGPERPAIGGAEDLDVVDGIGAEPGRDALRDELDQGFGRRAPACLL